VKVWDDARKSINRNVQATHSAGVSQVFWCSKEDEIYSTGRDRVIKIWNGADGRLKQTLTGHAHWINTLCVASGKMLSGSDDFTLILWLRKEDGNWTLQARLTGHQKLVNCVRFSPDGRFIASASFDKSIKIWSAFSGKFLFNLRGHVGEVYVLAWAPDSRLIVSGSKDSTVKVWSIEDKKLKEDLPGHADEVFVLDWSADGAKVASAGRDKAVKIWSH
jgi:ribosome assembly protein 4